MNTFTTNQKMLISALGGFILGAGAVWLIGLSEEKLFLSGTDVREEIEEVTEKAESDLVNSEESPVIKVTEGSTSVFASNQPAGAWVRASVTLELPGWVVVHEVVNGTRANALGAAWLPAGLANIDIELLRNTVAGNSYMVLLYTDDGDKEFELKEDALLIDASDQPIQAIFQATTQ